MEEVGYVKSTNGEYASVIFARKSGCGGNCGSCKGGCTADDTVSTQIKNTLDVAKGSRVKVRMDSKPFFKMIFWAYIFPSTMFLIGLVSGLLFFKSRGNSSYELFGALIGFAFLFIAYLLSGKVDKKVRENNEYELKMIQIVRQQ